MAHHIQVEGELFRVQLTGSLAACDLLMALLDLRSRPEVSVCRGGVWEFAADCVLPFGEFPMVRQHIERFDDRRIRSQRVALVVAEGLQFEMARLFTDELHVPRMHLRVFRDHASAAQWALKRDRPTSEEVHPDPTLPGTFVVEGAHRTAWVKPALEQEADEALERETANG